MRASMRIFNCLFDHSTYQLININRGPGLTQHIIVLVILLSTLIAPSANALQGKLNPNSATTSQLEQLPFIGTAKAKAIAKCRQDKGQFSSLAEIQACPEIGRSTFEAIKPYLVLSSPAASERIRPSDTSGTQAGSSYRVIPRIITKPGEIKVLEDSVYYDTLLSFISHAEHQIDITLFVFKTTPSPKNRPALLLQALAQAKKRGVAVTVLLDASNYDEELNKENQRTARLLRKQGITVRFDSPGTTTHSKLVVVDSRYCFVGSHNFTHSALAYNNELSLLVDNTALAKELERYIKAIK